MIKYIEILLYSEAVMHTTMNTPKTLLSVTDFMASTGLGRTKTYELIGSGELETVTVGRRRLVPAEALEDFVARLRGRARS